MRIIYKKVLNSTNTYAQENMPELEDKTFIHCDKQTNGKGQFARIWKSDVAENLYLTIVLKPKEKNYPLADLTIYMAKTLVNTLLQYGVSAEIKPPNDITVNGAKIAGILAQSSTKGEKINGIALGIGVNLNFSPEELAKIDQKATSLNLETKKEINRDEFLNNLANEFLLEYDNFIKNGLERICAKNY